MPRGGEATLADVQALLKTKGETVRSLTLWLPSELDKAPLGPFEVQLQTKAGGAVWARFDAIQGGELAALKALAEQSRIPVKVKSEVDLHKAFAAVLAALFPAAFVVLLVMQFRHLNPFVYTVIDATDSDQVPFSQIAGADEAKRALQPILDSLAEPAFLRAAGIRAPRGAVLHGPPGTGKTFLARGFAREAKCTFIYASAADFQSPYIGITARRVATLFRTARRLAPSVVFIDELDALLSKRCGASEVDRDAIQSVNAFLAELDGFLSSDHPETRVVVIGATNRPDALDPAVRRAKRLEIDVALPLPDTHSRAAILASLTDPGLNPGLPFHFNLDKLADRSVGFSPAQLERIVTYARLTAFREKKHRVGDDEVETALLDAVLGVAGRALEEGESRRRVAYHEAGHAVSAFVDEADRWHLEFVSLQPRGRSLGSTSLRPTKETAFLTQDDLSAQIRLLVAGGIGELLGCKNRSLGSADDLAKAMDLALEYEKNFGDLRGTPKSARRRVRRTQREVAATLETFANELHAIADALLTRGTLTRSDVAAIFASGPGLGVGQVE